MIKIIPLIITLVLGHTQLKSQSIEWLKSFGGSNSLEDGHAIAVDSEGSVYTVGTFFETTDFDPGPGVYNLTASNTDAYIQKLDANGNFLWARMLGGANDDQAFAVAVDAQDNVYFTSDFQSQATYTTQDGTQTLTSNGGYDACLQKLDSNGNLIWIKQIGANSTDGISSIAIDEQGDIYITGRFGNTLNFESQSGTVSITAAGDQAMDIYILKIDSDGNFIWVKRLGGESNDGPSSITTDMQGNVYLCGRFFYQTTLDSESSIGDFISNGNFDCFIVKLDSSGQIIWAKQIGGIETDWMSKIKVDAEGNIYTIGRFTGAVDFDPGNGSYEMTSNDFYNGYILKLTTDGEYAWAKQLTGNANGNIHSIAINNQGEIYLTGNFSGTTDFDPGVATHTLTAAGNSDLFLMKLNNEADLLWVEHVGATFYFAYGADVKVDSEDNVYATGTFGGAVDFGFGNASYPATSNGTGDVFVLKLSGGIINVSEYDAKPIVSLYPNPANSFLNIQSNEKIQIVSIYNLLGELVQTETRSSFSIEHLPIGVYMINIETTLGTINERFIIE